MLMLAYKYPGGDTMYELYSTLTGILIAVMIAFNGKLSEIIGNNLSTVIVHVVGLVSISLFLILDKRKIVLHKGIPIYLYSAGAIGVFTVLFSNVSFHQLGASLTFSLSLLGQSLASIIVDHFGWLGMKAVKFRKKKFTGLILISLGIVIMAAY